MCQECPTARSRARAVARELIADIVFLPLAIVAVVSGLVLLHHATSL